MSICLTAAIHFKLLSNTCIQKLSKNDPNTFCRRCTQREIMTYTYTLGTNKAITNETVKWLFVPYMTGIIVETAHLTFPLLFTSLRNQQVHASLVKCREVYPFNTL